MNTKKNVASLVMLVCLGVALGGAASAAAAGPDCSFLSERTPETMSLLWLKSLHHFVTRHPDLSALQQEVIRQAVALGTAEFFGSRPPASGLEKGVTAPAARLLAQATRAFSTAELGEIFAPMGQAQLHFFKLADAAPFCDCWILGAACTMGGGGPKGVCKEFSCTTWKGTEDGFYRIGMCSP